MGYRSQVEGLIYGDPEKIDVYIVKHKMQYGDKNVFEQFKDGEIQIKDFEVLKYGAVENGADDKPTKVPQKYIRLSGDDWKWYEDYDDVKMWEKFMTESEDFGLNWEFARVGEEADDVERRDGGTDVDWHINTYTVIEIDI